ncbi:MAG: hypothetical protein ABJH63_10555 [Rhizobiaceae bacterium]
MFFVEKPLGLLNVQLSNDDRRYMIAAKSGIPLHEGGVVFKGVVSPIDDARSMEIIYHVGPDILHGMYVDRVDANHYIVEAGPLHRRETFEITLQENSLDEQQVYCLVKNQATGASYKVVYTDFNEPVTAGTVIIIVGALVAIVCSLSLVIGLIANWSCKKVEVTFGFKHKKGDWDVGCVVRCIEGEDKGKETNN